MGRQGRSNHTQCLVASGRQSIDTRDDADFNTVYSCVYMLISPQEGSEHLRNSKVQFSVYFRVIQ